MAKPEELEERKQKEIEWADFRRTIESPELKKKYAVNSEFYQINRPVNTFVTNWLRTNLAGKDVFEMACGTKGLVSRARDVVNSAIASDIAPESIELAKRHVQEDPSFGSIDYRVVDAEKTGFADNSFDVVVEGGALHHMDLDAAYSEAARILRPGGKLFCVEALRHNPLIHWYRRRTPHLRTAWEVEHILGRAEIRRGLKHFDTLETHNFHIATLPAIPFRNTILKEPLLVTGEVLDTVLTRIPGFKWLSWQCVFVLEKPKK